MKIKKYLSTAVLIIFISSLLILGCVLKFKINHKNEVFQKTKIVPKFSCPDINGSVFSNQNLKKNSAFVFIYFNTDCEFCIEEAETIKRNIKQLRTVQLIFVSSEKPEIMKKFAQEYQLDKEINIKFLCDAKNTLTNIFDVKLLPSIVLYDKKQKLIGKITGKAKIERILRALESGELNN